jgi:hypothetical protein
MRTRVQEAVDEADGSACDAVLLGYALCNNGLHGVVARDVPLIFPRAHDCITLFMGCRKRYLEYFSENPGAYYKTSGWIERDHTEGDLQQLSIGHVYGMDLSFPEMVEKYGEDNARFLYDTLCHTTRHYNKLTFIEMGVEPDDRFERQTRQEAAERGWDFDKVRGDLAIFRKLADGDWDEDTFLIVPPGGRIVARYDERIVAVDAPDQRA